MPRKLIRKESKEPRYKVELANRGSDGPLLIAPYVVAVEFQARDDDDAIDTVNNILNGGGIVRPPIGTRFELWRLMDQRGNVILG